MQKFVFKRLVAIILILSMIMTTGGFATFADSISNTIESITSEGSTELSQQYNVDLVEKTTKCESEDTIASPSDVDDDKSEASSYEYEISWIFTNNM